MNKSDQIEMLASALSKFQGEIQNVFKGKKGYGYNYADLASILEDVRPLLCKHGLSLVQLAGNSGDNVSIETVLMHESGQYLSETILMPVDVGKGMTRAQAIGSVISYARRYALTSILAIAQTDTDGREGVEEERPKLNYNIKRSVAIIKETPQLTQLNQLMVELKVKDQEINQWCKKANVFTLEEIPEDKISLLVDHLQLRKEKNDAEEEMRRQYD